MVSPGPGNRALTALLQMLEGSDATIHRDFGDAQAQCPDSNPARDATDERLVGCLRVAGRHASLRTTCGQLIFATTGG